MGWRMRPGPGVGLLCRLAAAAAVNFDCDRARAGRAALELVS
jgi:hypothetical protein